MESKFELVSSVIQEACISKNKIISKTLSCLCMAWYLGVKDFHWKCRSHWPIRIPKASLNPTRFYPTKNLELSKSRFNAELRPLIWPLSNPEIPHWPYSIVDIDVGFKRSLWMQSCIKMAKIVAIVLLIASLLGIRSRAISSIKWRTTFFQRSSQKCQFK